MDKQTAYKRKIQKHLYFAGSLSGTDLSILTNKSLPLITRLLNELVEEGIVVETGFANSTGGRRPQMYSLKPDLMYVISVAMDQFITRMAITDMQGKISGEVKKIELKLTGNPDSLHQLKDHILQFIIDSNIPTDKIIGIGIGMPGFVDFKKGVNHTFLNTIEGNITNYLESATGTPVLIDNDASLIALAELKHGIARGKQNAMVINISWGVGLGMILNGKLFRGYNGFAGEFSHIPLFTNNKMCSCGKMGCLETETSLLVVVEKALEWLKQGRMSRLKDLSPDHLEETAKAIMDAAAHGDKMAIDLFSEIGYHIGRGVAILIHLLNPELIVLSGRGSIAGKVWLAPIQQAMNEHCIPKIAESTEVKISTLGYQSELIGAAALVMEHYDTIEKDIESTTFKKAG